MATAPGDILTLKQGATFAWQRAIVSVLADGTVGPVDLTDKPVTITMTHLASASKIVNAASVVVTNAHSGEVVFVLTPTMLATPGMHQCLWDIAGVSYPFEGYDLVNVEQRL